MNPILNRFRPPRPESFWRRAAVWMGVAVGCLCTAVEPVRAQQALRVSLSSQEAVELRQRQTLEQPYSVRWGDFKLLLGASLTGEYNDNVNVSDNKPEEDFILKPLLNLSGSYPITTRNLFRFNVGVGYDQYFQHDRYSALRLESGSEIAFDLYIKDLWINFHDRFSYVRDPGQEAAVVNNARYGGLDNLIGATALWDLQDVKLTLGYDHQNFIASADEYEYLNRNTELVLGRAGFQVLPNLAVGVEGTGSFTTYDDPILNDNTGYSGGVYADWRPGTYFKVQPRGGYAAYLFDQTSQVIRAADQDAWYADLTLTHDITDAVSYSVRVGHEIRLGIQADAIEDTYVHPSINWRIIKNLSLHTYLRYENGTQTLRGYFANAREQYDWFGGGIGLSHPLTRRFSLALNYSYRLRASDLNSRDYSQNLVGLRLTYQLK